MTLLKTGFLHSTRLFFAVSSEPETKTLSVWNSKTALLVFCIPRTANYFITAGFGTRSLKVLWQQTPATKPIGIFAHRHCFLVREGTVPAVHRTVRSAPLSYLHPIWDISRNWRRIKAGKIRAGTMTEPLTRVHGSVRPFFGTVREPCGQKFSARPAPPATVSPIVPFTAPMPHPGSFPSYRPNSASGSLPPTPHRSLIAESALAPLGSTHAHLYLHYP